MITIHFKYTANILMILKLLFFFLLYELKKCSYKKTFCFLISLSFSTWQLSELISYQLHIYIELNDGNSSPQRVVISL